MKFIFLVFLCTLLNDNIVQVKSNDGDGESNDKYNCQFRVSQKLVDALREAYRVINWDGNGDVSTKEILNVINNIDDSSKATKPEADELRQLGDKNKDGKVSEDEWIRFWVNRLIERFSKEVDEAFKVFDYDGNKLVSERELEVVFKELGKEEEEAHITAKDIVKTLDCQDHDGKLSKEEFIGLATAKYHHEEEEEYPI